MTNYNCKICGDKGSYCEEDYIKDGTKHSGICPFCDMPTSQLLKDITEKEGLIEALKQLFKRVKGKISYEQRRKTKNNKAK